MWVTGWLFSDGLDISTQAVYCGCYFCAAGKHFSLFDGLFGYLLDISSGLMEFFGGGDELFEFRDIDGHLRVQRFAPGNVTFQAVELGLGDFSHGCLVTGNDVRGRLGTAALQSQILNRKKS